METKIILLIDDSPISRRRSRHWLERAGYNVAEAVHSPSSMGVFVEKAQLLCCVERRPHTRHPRFDELDALRLRLMLWLTNHLKAKVQTLAHTRDFSEAKVAVMRRITDSLSTPSANPDEKIATFIYRSTSRRQGKLNCLFPAGPKLEHLRKGKVLIIEDEAMLRNGFGYPEFEKLTTQKPMEANDLLKRIDVLFHAA